MPRPPSPRILALQKRLKAANTRLANHRIAARARTRTIKEQMAEIEAEMRRR